MKILAVTAAAMAMIPKGIPTASPTMRPVPNALEGGDLDCTAGMERLGDGVTVASVSGVDASVVMVRAALVETDAIVPRIPEPSSTPTNAPGMK
jgi:hypothetical protein